MDWDGSQPPSTAGRPHACAKDLSAAARRCAPSLLVGNCGPFKGRVAVAVPVGAPEPLPPEVGVANVVSRSGGLGDEFKGRVSDFKRCNCVRASADDYRSRGYRERDETSRRPAVCDDTRPYTRLYSTALLQQLERSRAPAALQQRKTSARRP